jgi:hypothetical protein
VPNQYRSTLVQTHNQASASLPSQPTPSPRLNYENIFDRQRTAPGLTGEYFDYSSATFTPPFPDLGTLESRGAPANSPAAGSVNLTPTGDARADAIYDTARVGTAPMVSQLPTGGFLPSLISAKGDPFYGLGGRSTLLAGNGSGHIGFDIVGDTPITGLVRTQVDMAYSVGSDGTPTTQLIHAFGQAYGFIFGKADSAFSDPDVFPNTIDMSGPNAEVYLVHPLVACPHFMYQAL